MRGTTFHYWTRQIVVLSHSDITRYSEERLELNGFALLREIIFLQVMPKAAWKHVHMHSATLRRHISSKS